MKDWKIPEERFERSRKAREGRAARARQEIFEQDHEYGSKANTEKFEVSRNI